VTSLGNATFYNALKYAKERRWVIGGGRDQPYTLDPDGAWKEAFRTPSIGGSLEKEERVEKLEKANKRLTGSRKAIAAGEVAGTAIGALVTIMQDTTINTRRRIQAAEGLLAYKTPQDVADAAKLFLASVFMNPDENIDHRLAATTALRKSEDVRIMPAIERPAPRLDEVDLEEAKRQREEVYRRRVEHMKRVNAENAAELERQRAAGLIPDHVLAPKASSNGG
jgi:hypothetical protein